MNRRTVLAMLALALALSQLSCAAGTLTPLHDSMPAARAALRPEYRIFYDTLEQDGDWVLIEPYGYVFRPRVSFATWRPYQNGFWVPSDVYGWVWVSSEPFGWVTFHYGEWMYDDFQGWVWLPGADWGPAWVAWSQAGDYIGWAPLMPTQTSYSEIPGGPYTYVPTSQLPATNLPAHVMSAAQLGATVSQAKPILNVVERGGVSFNRGPRIEAIERVAGPLARVRLEDVTPGDAPVTSRRRDAAPRPREADLVTVTRRAAEDAARQARGIAERGGSPPTVVPVVRPAPARETPRGKLEAPKGEGAPADSAR